MNLTRAAIEKNRVTGTLLFVVLVAGLISYVKMPRNEDPGFIIRTPLVEQLVTDKLEKVIQEIPEIDYINSLSKTGISLVSANFKEQYREMRPLFDDLRRKVEKAESELPDGVIGPIVNDEFGDVFGTILAITGGEDFSYRELEDIADEVRDELLLIEEVAKVDVYGAQEERIFVEYNNARLSELRLSPMQLRDIVESRNIVIAGGAVRTDYEEFALAPSATSIRRRRRCASPASRRCRWPSRCARADGSTSLARSCSRPSTVCGSTTRSGSISTSSCSSPTSSPRRSTTSRAT